MLIVLLIIAPALLVVFAVAKFFLPFRSAIVMSVLTTLSGAFGFALALMVQAPFLPDTLESTTQVVSFLGIGCTIGIALAALAAWAVWRLRASKALKA